MPGWGPLGFGLSIKLYEHKAKGKEVLGKKGTLVRHRSLGEFYTYRKEHVLEVLVAL